MAALKRKHKHKRKHKRVKWRRPVGGKRRPGVFDATCAALVRAFENKEGVWNRIQRIAIVAGYSIARALGRVRGLRSDGAESLQAMVVAMLYTCDVRTGRVGKPGVVPGDWKDYTLSQLAQLAYGTTHEDGNEAETSAERAARRKAERAANLRRARRALDVMIHLGWLSPTKQNRRYVDENTYRSDPGERRLNLDKLCKMLGTDWLLKRDRQYYADRKGGKRLDAEASQQERLQEAARQDRLQEERAREAHQQRGPQSTSDPPFRAIRNILNC